MAKRKGKDKKGKYIHIRVSDLEKKTIKDKADLLDLTETDYVKECCIFSNATAMFMEKLHGSVKKRNSFELDRQ